VHQLILAAKTSLLDEVVSIVEAVPLFNTNSGASVGVFPPGQRKLNYPRILISGVRRNEFTIVWDILGGAARTV